jgi:trehalose 6-phosphate synthase
LAIDALDHDPFGGGWYTAQGFAGPRFGHHAADTACAEFTKMRQPVAQEMDPLMNAPDADPSSATGRHDLVVLANRLPVQRVGDSWRASPGGLARAMLGVLRSRRGAWIGWSGDITQAETWTDAESSASQSSAAAIGAGNELDDIEMIAVPLTESEFEHYYERVSNGALWPLFHDAIRQSTFDSESWEVYEQVNRRFAEAAAAASARGATVWVHDYHLLLVPGMLRALRPDLVIGFFLHIPFPPQELFMRMPWREEILDGLLGADVVGFQRHVGAENFQALAKRLLDADIDIDGVRTIDNRRVHIGTFPISIDVAEIESIARSPDTRQRADDIRARLGNPQTVFLGVDRLDYTKGIDLRLHSFRTLLDEQTPSNEPIPRSVSQTVLVQVAVPGREGVESYVEERHTVEQLVGDINGQYASIGYPVIHYLRRSLDLNELVALYLAADVMLVTPRRDGMNLVAKEFVAARLDDTGVLILSEFAGAADELTEALLVNPHDPDAIVAAMRDSVSMPQELAIHRMHELRAQVSHHTVDDWATSFLAAMAGAASHPDDPRRMEPNHV